MNKGTAIVGFFLCFLAGMALMWGLEHRDKETAIKGESGPIDHTTAKIPVDPATDPVWGNLDAPVTIVEISDFECPFCSRVNPTIKQIKDTYGPDKVRVVWKNNPLPFHKNATPTAEAAMAVFKAAGGGKKGSEAFFKFHDLAFQNQKQLTPGNLEKWAGQAGVDVAKFKTLAKAPDTKAKVQKDLAMAKSIGARGTPNFRINGVEVSGAQPFNKFKEVIDKELAEAKRLMASGVPAGQIYLRRLEKNAGGAEAEPEAKKPDQQKPPEDTTIWKVPVHDDDPVKGPADALVTVVEWSDYQCPFCSRVEPTIKKVIETYGKDVRVVWKDNPLPFHPRAKPAAAVARAAYDKGGDALFWKAHETLFANQKALEDADLQKYAGELGLNWTMVKKAIDDDKYGDRFQQSMDEAMDLKARGTPHFFVNGFRVSGAQPFEKFKEIIDQRLAEAKKLVAGGTPRAKVYEKIMETAKGPPEPETKEVPACNDCPFKGAANAKVVIQEFSDFQCPFCSRVEPTITQLEKEYGDQVKIVWRNMPLEFHKQAPLAAEAALEAFAQKGNAGFWKYHGALFAKQREPGALERAGLEKLAEEQGLNMAQFKAALDSHKHKARVDADIKVAKAAGITGTPGFVIGKYWLSGAQPFGQFKKLVELSLKGK
jgi:protein-disulfide isomerase